jgi:hypothetical protein
VHQPGARGRAAGHAGGCPGGHRGHGHRRGQQDHRLDPGRDGQGDARDQRGVPVDEQVHIQQQGHGHAQQVAMDAGGDEQHRADRDQDGGAGGELEGPPGPQTSKTSRAAPRSARLAGTPTSRLNEPK